MLLIVKNVNVFQYAYCENISDFTLKTNTEKQHDLYQRVIKQNEYENIIKLHYETL